MNSNCPNCGREIYVSNTFCPNCGRLLLSLTPETPNQNSGKPYPNEYATPVDRTLIDTLNNIPILTTAVQLLISYWTKPQARAELLGNSVRLGPQQFPTLYEMVEKMARSLNISTPEVFIKYDPVYNANTFGTNNDHFIVLHSSLVENFTEPELEFVLGHEMGHIKSQHVTYSTLAYYIAGCIGVFSQNLFKPLNAALLAWSRESEITADRVGLLVTGQMEPCISALLMFTIGSRKLVNELNLKSLIRQSSDLQGFHGFANLLINDHSHPYMVNRIQRLVQFGYVNNANTNNQSIPQDTRDCSESSSISVPDKLVFCEQCGFELTDGDCPICSSLNGGITW